MTALSAALDEIKRAHAEIARLRQLRESDPDEPPRPREATA